MSEPEVSGPDARGRSAHAPSARLMNFAVTGAATLVLIAGASFYYATQKSRGVNAGSGTQVAITSKACEPNVLTVAAGERTFEIYNKSDRPVEWEILDGVMVVAERENIVPGLKQTLKVRLSPGDYEVTCGLLSNPNGVLHVTPSQDADARPPKASMKTFLGPLSEYKFYLGRQSGAALRAAGELASAIRAGDLDKAKALYVTARQPYKRIEPVVNRFSDLENVIDPVADYFEKREDDPAFLGYHRIERGLFAQKSLDGLAPVADRLVADLTTLDARLRALKMSPDLLTTSAGGFITQLSQDRLIAGENHYAQTDLSDIEANLEGVGKIAGLLKPVVKPLDPDLAATIDTTFNAAEGAVAKHKSDAGFPPYDTIGAEQRKALADAFVPLGDALNRLPQVIGVGSDGT